ncbi:MAG: hypothetical protein ABI579_05375, partial [Candidatus Sumerlaeota bacterium]
DRRRSPLRADLALPESLRPLTEKLDRSGERLELAEPGILSILKAVVERGTHDACERRPTFKI